MEGRFVVTALIFTILAACSKQEINVQSLHATPVQDAAAAGTKASVYTSGWETVPAWNKTTGQGETHFSYTRLLPQLKKQMGNNGAVLVFARNVWVDDTVLKTIDDAPEKPLMMPFYFLPYLEKPNYTEQWNYSAGEDKINVSLVIKGGKIAAPSKKVELQFVVIPAQLLNEKKKTAQTVRKLSYDQLVRTFSLGS